MAACYTWIVEKSLLDMVDHRYSWRGYYKDGCVTSGRPRRKQSTLPTAATSPSYHRLQNTLKWLSQFCLGQSQTTLNSGQRHVLPNFCFS